ncbi:MAG: DUF4292 domain-containing protein [Sandaracinaceae bacterium]
MKARWMLFATLTLGAATLAGCPGRPCPTQPFTDPSSALDAYRDMRSPARVLRAEARVERRDTEGRIRGTVLMYIDRPDRVRFDAQTQFGPAAILTSDGDAFALTDLGANRFLFGPTCPSNIERMLGLRFSAPEVTRLLLGETPRIEATSSRMRCDDGRYLVTLEDARGRRQELELEVREQDIRLPPDEQRMRLRKSEVFAPDGSLEWRVTYDDYRFVRDPSDDDGRGVVMPYTVRFEDPRRGADTRVRFNDVELNVAVPDGVFSQVPRPGLAEELVECE